MLSWALMTAFFSVYTAAATAAAENGDQPMVAFICNRPAMHMTDRGWVEDGSTNCLKDPVDILNYCHKVYPKLEVWNIVEASQPSTIKNWCNFGHSRCHNKISVRPYRCLIGSFESEALEVPEHCHFDHVHDAELCKSFSDWNQTTTELCSSRGSRLRGFSILQPCGINGFNGAEYVCCPLHMPSESTEKHDSVSYTTRSSTAVVTKRTTGVTPTSSATSSSTSTSTSSSVTAESEYLRYLRIPVDPNLSEHEYYLHAKTDLDKRHHEKVTKMMKEWASARHRVQEIKKTDAKGGEKFNREMTARFQKAYESLDREGLQQKKQLASVHQQRVQAEQQEGKECKNTWRQDAPLRVAHEGCTSTKEYRPKYCSTCKRRRCCWPDLSKTLTIEMNCPGNRTVAQKFMWIKSCRCKTSYCY